MSAISLYYAARKLLSVKTHVFVDFVVSAFNSKRSSQFGV